MTNAKSQCITASYKLSLCYVRKLLRTIDFFQQNFIVMYFLQYISSFLTACGLLVGEFSPYVLPIHIRDDIINNVDSAHQSKVLVSASVNRSLHASLYYYCWSKKSRWVPIPTPLCTATIPVHIHCHHELVLLSKTL